MERIPPATQALLFANGAMYALQLLLGDVAFIHLMLWPAGDFALGMHEGQMLTAGFLPWQLLTYGFLHGSFAHLFFNMLALFMFGGAIEQAWGSRRFGYYVIFCIVGAGLCQLVVGTLAVNSGSDPYPTVGASGGVFGVLLAFGMFFPNQRVMLLFPPIPMKARTLVIGYGALELFLGVTGTNTGIAHFAHLGGMAFGFLLIQYWRGRWPFSQRKR